MPKQGQGHEHEHDAQGDALVWRVFDVAIWVAVVVIFAVGVEWIAGAMIRERIARGAQKYLHKQATEATAE